MSEGRRRACDVKRRAKQRGRRKKQEVASSEFQWPGSHLIPVEGREEALDGGWKQRNSRQAHDARSHACRSLHVTDADTPPLDPPPLSPPGQQKNGGT